MAKNNHLNQYDRNKIQGGLLLRKSLKQIASELEKSPSTISREIKLHMKIVKKGAKWSHYFNDCIHRKSCTEKYICDDLNCVKKKCGFCGKCIN